MERIFDDGITFDDVLLVPQYSEVTPDLADTGARLTRNIRINIPIVSAPMDTVTESALAIALAQEGGLGIIHKNMPVEDQARDRAWSGPAPRKDRIDLLLAGREVGLGIHLGPEQHDEGRDPEP